MLYLTSMSLFKKILLIFSSFIVFSTVFCARDFPICAADEIDPPAEAQPHIRAKLSSAKTHFLLGEPIWVTFSLMNAGNESIDVVRCSPPGSSNLNYEILPPNEQPHTYKPMVIHNNGRNTLPISLSPTDSFSCANDLTFERQYLLITKPGEYIIHAFYSLSDGVKGGPLTIRSNGICIVAEEPTGTEKAVYDLLMKRIAPKKTNGVIWSVKSVCIKDYEEILDQFPHSAYAVGIHYYLGQAYESLGTLAKNPEITIPAFKKAIEHFQLVVESKDISPIRAYASQLAGRVSARLADVKASEKKFRVAFTLPDTTADRQLEILSWFVHLELGTFRENSVLVKPGDVVTAKVMLPLLPYAQALGYKLEKDEKTGESVLIRDDYKLIVKPGENPLPVCGILCKDMRVEIEKDGSFMVSPSVVALLLAERYGKGMADALTFILIPAK